MGVPEKIKKIEEEMRKTQINKATEHHVGLLRAKLAKLKQEQEEARSSGQGSSVGFNVKKSGDSTVALVGLPNVGKSTLLNRLTNSKSRVGSYRFTTLTVIPGILEHKGAKIQILDLPGIIKEASSGKGLGKRILSAARSADMILLMIDVFQPEIYPVLLKELRGMGIRPDERPPNIIIEKNKSGGISITNMVKLTKLSNKLITEIFHVYRINSARVLVKEDITAEQLVDAILGTRQYIPTLTVLNKVDLVNLGFINEIKSRLKTDFIPISADADMNIQALKEHIYQRLDFIRIYLRPKGGETDYVEPLIIKSGACVQDICEKIHRSMKKEFRYAQIWGKSAKHRGQRVGLDHRLQDEDVITLIKQ